MNNSRLATVCDDLTQLKGNITQFQGTLKGIFEKAPTIEDYKELLQVADSRDYSSNQALVDRLRSFIDTPHIRVAVRMRELYENGLLPLLSLFYHIDFKKCTISDKIIGQILDYNPVVLEEMKMDVQKMNQTVQKYSKELSTDSYPPSLPPIDNESLLLRIRTDYSYRQLSDFLESSPADLNKTHNARLALRGRSLIEFILSQILDEKFPQLYDKDVLVLRQYLLSPMILTKFAYGYNLVDIMKYNISVEAELEEKIKAISNIFLAYIAGLELNGYDISDIKKWLNKLYDPLITNAYVKQDPIGNFYLAELDALFCSITNLNMLPKESISYQIIQVESQPYVAQVLINGEKYGYGASNDSFDKAKVKAAESILKDKELMNQLFHILSENYLRNNSKQETPLQITYPTAPSDQPYQLQIQQQQQPQPQPQQAPLLYPAQPQPYPSVQQFQSRSQPQPSSTQFQMQPQIYQSNPYPNAYPSQVPPPFQQGQQAPQFHNSPAFSHNQMIHPNDPNEDYKQNSASYQQIPSYQSPVAQHAYASRAPVPTPMATQRANNPDYPYVMNNSGVFEINHSFKDVDVQAKADLHALLGKVHLAPIYKEDYYETENKAKIYVNDVYIEGVLFGRGYDSKKKISAQKAAMCALHDKEKLDQYTNF